VISYGLWRYPALALGLIALVATLWQGNSMAATTRLVDSGRAHGLERIIYCKRLSASSFFTRYGSASSEDSGRQKRR